MQVVHDGRGGCAALFEAHAMRCTPLWDTQVGCCAALEGGYDVQRLTSPSH